MKSIPIYIIDNAKIEENENLGFKKNKVDAGLIEFKFNEKALDGYWIDPDIHDDTHSIDIVFYVHGEAYRTPYKKETEILLNSILLNQ